MEKGLIKSHRTKIFKDEKLPEEDKVADLSVIQEITDISSPKRES